MSDAKSSFFASNEYDYFRSPKRDPNDRSEIVLGFGSNGSWDIAARTGAEKMVLGDWSLGPLVMNENLFRPIFLISSTRAEFIANLAGVPNYSKAENLTSIFLNIRNRLSENPRGYPQRTEEIVNQLRALGDRRIGPQQINFIRRMQAALPPDNPDVSPNAYGKNSSLEEILFAFESRYASAALEESVHNGDPFFHFLASEEAYQRVRKLQESVEYAYASFDDSKLVERISQTAQFEGYEGISIHWSNIPDSLELNYPGSRSGALNLHSQILGRQKGISPENIRFYETQGLGPVHTFTNMSLQEINPNREE